MSPFGRPRLLGGWCRCSLIVALLLAVGGEAALAAGTTAGTVLTSTGSATFTDVNGTTYTALSNTITTTVQNAPSLTMSTPGAQNVARSQLVVDAFVLTNTGNNSGTLALSGDATLAGSGAATLQGYVLNSAPTGTCSVATPCTYTTLNSQSALTGVAVSGTVTVGVQYLVNSGDTASQTVQVTLSANITYAAGTGTTAQTSSNVTATPTDTVQTDARLDLALSATQPSGNAVIPYTLKVNNGGGFATTALNLSTPLSGVSATQGVFVSVPVPVWSSSPLAVSSVSTSVGNGYAGSVTVYYSTSSSGTSGWTTTAPGSGTAYFIGVYTSAMLPANSSGSTAWIGSTAPTVTSPEITLNFSLAQPAGSYAAGTAGSVLVVADSVTGNNASTQQIVGPGASSGTAYNAGNASTVIQGMIANTTAVSASNPGGSGYSNQTSNQANLIQGTVFEDINFGGGAGRSLGSSSGAAVSGARVELYNSGGTYNTFTTTAANGTYYFAPASAATYTVRVANGTVASTRSGFTGGLYCVQTYRTNASSGSAVAVTDHVGGETPTLVDAGSNASGTLASLTSGGATAQSITSVAFSSSTVNGVDFGFNYDTIVNTNTSGQGSLQAFMNAAQNMSKSGLAQSGLTAGVETSIFMISDGNAHAGLRAGLTNQLTSGVANISVPSLLYVTLANTTVDGSTQRTNVGNTNNVTLGTGGTVGTDALALPQLAAPVVQLIAGGGQAAIFLVEASNVTIENLALDGPTVNALVFVFYTTDSGVVIQNNVIGGTATFTDPGSSLRSGDAILVGGASTGGTIQNNLIGYTTNVGVLNLDTTASGWTVSGNELRGNLGAGALQTASNTTITGNLFVNNAGPGIDTGSINPAVEGATMTNNTVTGNGVGVSGTSAGVDPGIRLSEIGKCSASSVVTSATKNIIYNNYGAGILVDESACATLTPFSLSKNSIYGNGTISNNNGAGATGELGIDVIPYGTGGAALGASPFVTANTLGSNGSGTLPLNFPVFDGAYISSGNLVLTGWAQPGSVMELSIAQAATNGFGQGKTYLTTLTEGSGSSPIDTDSTTGSYASPYSGSSLVGTDTTNRFQFSVATPGGVSAGTVLTAFAKLNNNVSEFSQNITVSGSVPSTSVTLAKVVSPSGNQPPGTLLTYTTTFTNNGSAAVNTFSVVTPEPNNTDFQVGSASASVGSTNLTVSIAYSNNGGSTYVYTPASGTGGAPTGYDRTVTNVRYTFTGTLEHISPYNTATYTMAARIQ